MKTRKAKDKNILFLLIFLFSCFYVFLFFCFFVGHQSPQQFKWRASLRQGMECQREALEKGLKGLIEVWNWHFDDKHCALRFTYTCDCGHTQIKVLTLAANLDEHMPCHFENNMDRLPKYVQSWIEAASPKATDSIEVKQKAYQDIRTYLHCNRHSAFPLDATSYCTVHWKRCPIVKSNQIMGEPTTSLPPPMAPPPSSGELISNSISGSVGSGDNSGGPSGILGSPTPFAKGRYTFHVGGWTCVAWSGVGSQTGSAHDSEVPLSIFLEERMARAEQKVEDGFFGECVPRFPVKEKLADTMADTHVVLWIYDDPSLHGQGVNRKRVHIAGIAKHRFKWIGPIDYPSDFKQRFHRISNMTGVDWLLSSNDERLDEYVRLAQIQGHHLSPEQIQAMNGKELLCHVQPPGANRRYKEWHAQRQQHQDIAHYFGDLQHHAGSKGCGGGANFPCMLTHGTLLCMGLSVDNWKIATANEHLAAQGLAMFEPMAQKYGNPRLYNILNKLTTFEKKLLAGNGMHLRVEAAWIYYVLSNIVPVDQVMRPLLTSMSAEWDSLPLDEEEMDTTH